MFWTSFVAWRYFRSNKKDSHVNMATAISVFTSTLTIIGLILSFSIFRGYNEAIIDKLTKSTGHVVISNNEPFSADEILSKIKLKHEKIVETYGMISSGSFSNNVYIAASSNKNVRRSQISTSNTIPIIVSKTLADAMNYRPSDIINIIIPVCAPAPFFLLPENITCEIIAIEKLDSDDFNENSIMMNIKDLQQILSLNDNIHKIKFFSDKHENSLRDFKAIKKLYPEKNVQSWEELNEYIMKMIKSEQNIFMILLVMLIILSFLLYLLAISMFIHSKSRDIRIFKILGATRGNINSIFLQYSLILYITNLIIGSIIGVLLSKNINNLIKFMERTCQITIFPQDAYLISSIPTKLTFMDLGIILGGSFLISFFTSLYVSRKMSSIDVFKNL